MNPTTPHQRTAEAIPPLSPACAACQLASYRALSLYSLPEYFWRVSVVVVELSYSINQLEARFEEMQDLARSTAIMKGNLRRTIDAMRRAGLIREREECGVWILEFQPETSGWRIPPRWSPHDAPATAREFRKALLFSADDPKQVVMKEITRDSADFGDAIWETRRDEAARRAATGSPHAVAQPGHSDLGNAAAAVVPPYDRSYPEGGLSRTAVRPEDPESVVRRYDSPEKSYGGTTAHVHEHVQAHSTEHDHVHGHASGDEEEGNPEISRLKAHELEARLNDEDRYELERFETAIGRDAAQSFHTTWMKRLLDKWRHCALAALGETREKVARGDRFNTSPGAHANWMFKHLKESSRRITKISKIGQTIKSILF